MKINTDLNDSKKILLLELIDLAMDKIGNFEYLREIRTLVYTLDDTLGKRFDEHVGDISDLVDAELSDFSKEDKLIKPSFFYPPYEPDRDDNDEN